MREYGNYELHERLGKGLQGKVYRAVDKDTGRNVALKFIDRNALVGDADKNLRREVAAMQAIAGHKHVVRLFDVHWNAQFPKKNGETKETVALVQELASGGELFNYLMFTGCFDEICARTYFQQLISGLAHCHDHGVTHRDIKAENILLDGEFNLKLADYGLSAKHEADGGGLTKLQTTCGTPGYMAPEILKGGKYDGPPTDVWSAGVLLFIMLSGFPPLQRAARGDWWFDRIRHKQMSYFWDAHLKNAPNFPKGAQQLLDKLFVADPKERATIEQIQADPWFKGEVADLAALAQELSTRKQKVQEIMAQNRAAKESKKKKKRRRRAEDQEYDAYEEEVYRGMSDGEGESKQQANGEDDDSDEGDGNPQMSKHLFGKLAAPPSDIMAAAEQAGASAAQDA